MKIQWTWRKIVACIIGAPLVLAIVLVFSPAILFFLAIETIVWAVKNVGTRDYVKWNDPGDHGEWY